MEYEVPINRKNDTFSFVLENRMMFGLRPLKNYESIYLGDCSKHYAFLQGLNEGEIQRRTYPPQAYCSTVPLSGTTEMEMELTVNGVNQHYFIGAGVDMMPNNIMSIGVMSCPRTQGHSWSKKDSLGVCAGTKVEVWWQCDNRLFSSQDSPSERHYGNVNLRHLVVGDKIGLQIDKDGDLTFFFNGRSQGLATKNCFFHDDQDLYAVVDLKHNSHALRVTRAGRQIM